MTVKVGKSGKERRKEAVMAKIKKNISAAKPLKGSNLRGEVMSAKSLRVAKDRAHEMVERQFAAVKQEGGGRVSEETRKMITRGVEIAFEQRNRS